MATKVNINGKLVSRPGVYTLVKSGISNASPNLAAGNVCIIDDGIGAGFGGGVGGTVYPFDTVQDFQNFVKGGELWNLGAPLFKPGTGYNGVTRLFLISARADTPATIAFTIAAGTCSFVTKDQGLNANGVADGGGVLRQGYGATLTQVNPPSGTTGAVHAVQTPASSGVAEVDTITITTPQIGDTIHAVVAGHPVSFVVATTNVADAATGLANALTAVSAITAIVTVTHSAGVVTLTAVAQNTAFVATSSVTAAPGQFRFTFYHGTFKGIDPLNNTPYDGVTEANAAPAILVQSPVVSTLDDLKAWALKSTDLNTGFTYTIGTGAILASDVSANPGTILAAGATETYSPAAWQAALQSVANIDNNFFLCTKYGADAQDQHNFDILDVAAAGKYDRFLFIGGGATYAELTTVSKAAAQAYNSDRVTICHGDGKSTVRNGYKRRSSLYKAAAELGRLCGLDVQTPLTFKQIAIDAEWDPIPDAVLNDADNGPLAYGVLISYFDTELGYTVVLEDVNSLQDNENLVNDDASSFNIAVKRITAQLNKEVAISLKKKFFGNQTQGPNRNTVSTDDVIKAVEGFLQSRVANAQQDNYIIRFQNITAYFDQDNLYVNYEFVPNFEVSKIIVTGVILAS